MPALDLPSNFVLSSSSSINERKNTTTVANDNEQRTVCTLTQVYGAIPSQNLQSGGNIPPFNNYPPENSEEVQPLLDDRFVEVQNCHENGHTTNVVSCKHRFEKPLIADDLELEIDHSKYLSSGLFARVFPIKIFNLIGTLILEIPVLLMISGSINKTCDTHPLLITAVVIATIVRVVVQLTQVWWR